MELPFDSGLLFVAATLLPLASFALLLLWGAVRWALRPYANDGGPAAVVFDALGGAVGGRGPAYVATAAIALACACSIYGFVLFWADQHHHEADLAKLNRELKVEQIKLQGEVGDKADPKDRKAIEAR